MGLGREIGKQPTANCSTNNVTPGVSRAASPQPSSINVISPMEEGGRCISTSIVSGGESNSLFTRRSQFKKQTPSTIISSCSNHDLNGGGSNLDRNDPVVAAQLQRAKNYRKFFIAFFPSCSDNN